MPAFLPPAPLPAPRRPPPHPRRAPRPRRAAPTALDPLGDPHGDPRPSSLSLDLLPSFEAFCWRTQDALCAHAAAADGLGVFHVPSSAGPGTRGAAARSAARRMRGGRAFADASVSVFRSPRRAAPRATAAPAAAGVSLTLRPRDPALPQLRAAAHYFQRGARAWWFAGSADLALPRGVAADTFARAAHPFLTAWAPLTARFRARRGAAARDFLTGCLDAAAPGDVAVDDVGAAGATDTAARDTSFRFVCEFVDAVLPAYLPLVLDGAHGSAARPRDGADDGGVRDAVLRLLRQDGCDGEALGLSADGGVGGGGGAGGARGAGLPPPTEEVERFALVDGGAACEKAATVAAPLVSWRFSLAPPALSAAGRTYDAMRQDGRNVEHARHSMLFM